MSILVVITWGVEELVDRQRGPTPCWTALRFGPHPSHKYSKASHHTASHRCYKTMFWRGESVNIKSESNYIPGTARTRRVSCTPSCWQLVFRPGLLVIRPDSHVGVAVHFLVSTEQFSVAFADGKLDIISRINVCRSREVIWAAPDVSFSFALIQSDVVDKHHPRENQIVCINESETFRNTEIRDDVLKQSRQWMLQNLSNRKKSPWAPLESSVCWSPHRSLQPAHSNIKSTSALHWPK